MRLGDLWAKHGDGTLQPDSAQTKDLFIFGVTDDSRDVRYGFDFRRRPVTKKIPFSDATIIREIAALL